MNETEQDLQKRELVFRVLDQLKENGERINADKVARLAKMGKQTVLPYYREWRFLDDVDREQQEELPDELVRVLKRGIAKWKHTIAEQAQAFEEAANAEIDELKQTVQQLSDSQAELADENRSKTAELSNAEEKLAELQSQLNSRNEEIAGLTKALEAAKEKQADLQEQLKNQKQDFTEQAEALETRLDQRHQEQLNHWMKVVDDERRQKAEAEKRFNQQKECSLAREKEANELGLRLDNKTRAYMDACEERNRLRKDQKPLQQTREVMNQSLLLLDCSETELTTRLRTALNRQHQADMAEQKLAMAEQQTEDLQSKLQEQENRLNRQNALERELEKAKGYIQALEKSIPVGNDSGDTGQ